MTTSRISPNGTANVRRRLLLLSSEFRPGPGGIGTHAYQLARHLARRQWEVRVVAVQAYVENSQRETFNESQSFDILPLIDRDSGPGWQAARMRQIVGAARAWQPDAMIASGRRMLWTAAVITPLVNRPWLAVGHGSEFQDPSSIGRRLTRTAVERASAVVAVSDYTALLVEDMSRPQRLEVIRNAADGERFGPDEDTTILEQQLGLEGHRVLLTVGNVSERKAQDVVIRALPEIVKEFPDVIYLIAGWPTQQDEFSQLAEDLGVANHVKFAGVVDDELLPGYFNLCDIFVLVSRASAGGDVEGYGIVVQEAALCGKPAVVSSGCGLTEAIEEGISGVSVPPDAPSETAVAILSLLRDPDQLQAMGLSAREKARKTTWTERIADYDRLLREVIV